MTKTRSVSEPCGIPCTAFSGSRQIASGDLREVALKVRQALDEQASASVLIFNDRTSEIIEVDFRGAACDVLRRLPKPAKKDETAEPEEKAVRGPGRPKLGVVPREITLLPRHWDWLATQPGGASVALRKLVEQARHTHAAQDRERQSREATYRFMSAMAGNEPGFEEASRALFAGDLKGLHKHIAAWPADVREHTRKLAESYDG